MYARTTTLRGNPQAVDDLVATVRDEVMPRLMQLEGCVGLSLLVDRDAGRAIATSAWETEEAMRASAEQVRPSPGSRGPARSAPHPRSRSGRSPSCTGRTGSGTAPARGWSGRAPTPANLDRVIEAYRDSLMPWWEQTEGFCSNSFLMDRQEGRCSSTVVFESREAMAHTRDQFTTLREEFVTRMGMEILEVAEFDMALAHLRVPETV